MTRPRNLAAAAGGWSARHRRRAILGWLAFVVIAFAVGTAVGQRYLTDVQQTNGQAKQALDATIVRAVLLPSAMKLLGDWNWYLPRLPERSHHHREGGGRTQT